MKKIYPIYCPIEVNDNDRNESIDMLGLPGWLKKEMNDIAEIEKVNIRNLSFKREIYYSPEDFKWIDNCEISLGKSGKSKLT